MERSILAGVIGVVSFYTSGSQNPGGLVVLLIKKIVGKSICFEGRVADMVPVVVGIHLKMRLSGRHMKIQDGSRNR